MICGGFSMSMVDACCSDCVAAFSTYQCEAQKKGDGKEKSGTGTDDACQLMHPLHTGNLLSAL